jgi:predicted DNA-binding protein (MmcQ/YjbR family)
VPHPVTFADDDPYLADVRRLALALPEVVETVSHGRPTFWAGARGRTFATYGRTATSPAVLLVRPDPGDREALLADPRVLVPAYVGVAGWLGLDLLAAPVDLDEVAELLDASYRLVALRRQLRALDAAG